VNDSHFITKRQTCWSPSHYRWGFFYVQMTKQNAPNKVMRVMTILKERFTFS